LTITATAARKNIKNRRAAVIRIYYTILQALLAVSRRMSCDDDTELGPTLPSWRSNDIDMDDINCLIFCFISILVRSVETAE